MFIENHCVGLFYNSSGILYCLLERNLHSLNNSSCLASKTTCMNRAPFQRLFVLFVGHKTQCKFNVNLWILCFVLQKAQYPKPILLTVTAIAIDKQ